MCKEKHSKQLSCNIRNCSALEWGLHDGHLDKALLQLDITNTRMKNSYAQGTIGCQKLCSEIVTPYICTPYLSCMDSYKFNYISYFCCSCKFNNRNQIMSQFILSHVHSESYN